VDTASLYSSKGHPSFRVPTRSILVRACSIITIPCGLNEIKKIMKDFNLFEIETHLISPNPYRLRIKRTDHNLAGS
jgi:hypothetical protein